MKLIKKSNSAVTKPLLAACGFTLMLSASQVMAAPITGTIDFQGMSNELDLGAAVFGIDLNMDSTINGASGAAFGFGVDAGDLAALLGPIALTEFQSDFGGNASHILLNQGGFEIELFTAQLDDGSSGTVFADFSGQGVVRYVGGNTALDLEETAIQWEYASAANALSYTLGITTITPTSVPLPASAWLFLSAVTGLLVSRKRQS